jgi:glycosyltransferase involved in cell wall biosynthesis
MMHQPSDIVLRISVIIPHLNEPDNLRRCLAALEAGSARAPSFEIIVADNGSKELPVTVCAASPRTVLVVEPLPGPGHARNRAVAVARGEFLVFIDADCYTDQDCLTRFADFLDLHPEIDILGGDIRVVAAQPGKMTIVESYEAIFSYRIGLLVRRHSFAATGNMAVRADVFRSVGPFEGIARHEDKAWGQRAKAQGYRIAYLPEAIVSTPGCPSLAALDIKIERHVAHDFAELEPGWKARGRWLMLSAAMLVSPLASIGEIAGSRHVKGVRLKLGAFFCLVWTRWYRAWLMLATLRGQDVNEYLGKWKRPSVAPGSD